MLSRGPTRSTAPQYAPSSPSLLTDAVHLIARLSSPPRDLWPRLVPSSNHCAGPRIELEMPKVEVNGGEAVGVDGSGPAAPMSPRTQTTSTLARRRSRWRRPERLSRPTRLFPPNSWPPCVGPAKRKKAPTSDAIDRPQTDRWIKFSPGSFLFIDERSPRCSVVIPSFQGTVGTGRHSRTRCSFQMLKTPPREVRLEKYHSDRVAGVEELLSSQSAAAVADKSCSHIVACAGRPRRRSVHAARGQDDEMS